MTSMALDIATLIYAFRDLEKFWDTDPAVEWQPHNDSQQQFLDWYQCHGNKVSDIPGLTGIVSEHREVLVNYLKEYGYNHYLRSFDGVGVVSLFDLCDQWRKPGQVGVIRSYIRSNRRTADFDSVRLPAATATLYGVQGWHDPLVALDSDSGMRLWLMPHYKRPRDGLSLFATALDVLSARKGPVRRYSGAEIPMLDLSVDPDVSWLIGYDTHVQGTGYQVVAQTFQSVGVSLDQHGFRAKVMSVVATERSAPSGLPPYVLNQPFLGFFTTRQQPTIPLACFWADYDSWRTPLGLE